MIVEICPLSFKFRDVANGFDIVNNNNNKSPRGYGTFQSYLDRKIITLVEFIIIIIISLLITF